ncbi:MAG: Quinone oxidoreductase 1 [Alphaproteobacteria bacterium MarineAlpha9_Bin3]|nr:MAG: Quinone oxidoreductase 1 [Alphaproteobacteria bacterium MarineAlpha9_Bin3]
MIMQLEYTNYSFFIMSKYNAILCNSFGPIENLKYTSFNSLPIKKSEVRLDVKACGINFPDKLMIEGKYQLKPSLPFIPGMELSGVISESNDNKYPIGKKVIYQMRYGAYSEEVIANSNDLKEFPKNFSYEEAASFSIASQTAYVSLIERANIMKGQTILIMGAAGGVGLAAVQLAKAIGALPIAVCSTKKKQNEAIKAGAKFAIGYKDMVNKVKEITQNEGVDIIYDPIGGEYFKKSLKVIKWGGKLLVIGFASGSIPTLAVNIALIKGISIIGVRAGEYYRKFPTLKTNSMNKLLSIANKGLITPIIYDALNLKDAVKALKKIENREVIGRLVLKP